MSVNIFESHTIDILLCDANMFSASLLCLFISRYSGHRQ